ncbi:hypothetical protein V500_08455 [Pseudogymnoascus sp. VKM F-4518 (FW-2643)]|nr:hypothetical protein V500_08455 [Pseudogymnoascus sp. VKM F-4518 (FW-2643)]
MRVSRVPDLYNMSRRAAITGDDSYASRIEVLQYLYARNSSPQQAAEALASISLSTPSELAVHLTLTWTTLIIAAREHPSHQAKLADVLASLALLPDAQKNAQGDPVIVHNMRVWADLPTLAWEFNYEWNGFVVPLHHGPERDATIARFVNTNRFAARLMATHLPAFSCFSLFALWTMRAALETPLVHVRPDQSLDAHVPAAAAWIDVLGPQIYEWDEEFEYGSLIGDGGVGGPLWDGKHGFCRERWGLWRERFGGLAGGEEGLSEDVKAVARKAEEKMRDIEMAAV